MKYLLSQRRNCFTQNKFYYFTHQVSEMNLFETLEEQLRKEPNFVTDNGELKNGWC